MELIPEQLTEPLWKGDRRVSQGESGCKAGQLPDTSRHSEESKKAVLILHCPTAHRLLGELALTEFLSTLALTEQGINLS